MKKIIMLMLLTSYPLAASVNCLDNSQHLAEDFDDKEWHSVACNCPCEVVVKNQCRKCEHLQNAGTYVVVLPTKVAQHKHIAPLVLPNNNPQTILRRLVAKYWQKKKN